VFPPDELLVDTLELVRVLVLFVETFAFELPEAFVPLFVLTVDERLLSVAFSLVVAERVFTFVPDEFDLETTPSLVEVDLLVSAPSLNEALRVTLPVLPLS
jgi:hypothetical protein